MYIYLICDVHLQHTAPVSQVITLDIVPLVNMRHSRAAYGPCFTSGTPVMSTFKKGYSCRAYTYGKCDHHETKMNDRFMHSFHITFYQQPSPNTLTKTGEKTLK